MKTSLKLALLLLFLGAATVSAQYDVPFVPTDMAVVDSMLAAAGVGPGDVLYDLGCGDGRIVIGAARRGVAKAVGIDINPVRIKESKANAELAKVADEVDFREANIFESDYRDATVITMYLLTSVNLRLRPTFFETLKPGTRLVSHDFNMGDWKADREIDVVGEDGWGMHGVYFWVMPANISGDWTFSAGDLPHVLHIGQKYQEVTGTMEVNQNKREIPGMKLTGDSIEFTVTVPRTGGAAAVYQYQGKASGDTITGTITSGQTATPWTARRDPKTMTTIITATGPSGY